MNKTLLVPETTVVDIVLHQQHRLILSMLIMVFKIVQYVIVHKWILLKMSLHIVLALEIHHFAHLKLEIHF